MNQNLYAIIMAGGKGERFWPLSTSKTPKQMLSIFGDKPLLRMAVERLDGLIPPERIFVITSADLIEAAAEAAPELPRLNIIGEPFGRDTAAACSLGWAIVNSLNSSAAMCVLTADHIIHDTEGFRRTLSRGFETALTKDCLVTIGIQPVKPSTGFGYIEAGERMSNNADVEMFQARRFVEKPDLETARSYVSAGNYFWNSGMFVWSLKSFGRALERFQPHLLAMGERLSSEFGKDGFADAMRHEYGKIEKISVDYAIMEKSDNIVTARGAFDWDDVGSWPALENHFEKDHDGNTILGSCEEIDSENNVVVSGNRLTALIGVRDLVVVHAEGATLVCKRDRAQDVKAMVGKLREKESYKELL